MAAAPVISPSNGWIPPSGQAVTITDATSGASIYYTTDFTVPSAANGTKYTGPFTVTANGTVMAIATGGGYSDSPVTMATYTVEGVAAVPVIAPAGGAVPSGQLVTLTDSISGVSIYYTTDGSTPSVTNGTLYTAPFAVTSAETVKAIAVGTGYVASTAASAAFTIEPLAPAPVVAPASGPIPTGQLVTITDSLSGSLLYYTTDGSTPSAINGTIHGTLYTAPFSVTTAQTVTVIAAASGYSNSLPATAVYTIEPVAATPVISLAAGTYNQIQTTAITDSTPGASIYYTSDGSTPSATNGALYTGPITISKSATIEAVAVAAGYSTSAAATAAYTINLPMVAAPVISPGTGTYTQTQSVTITDTTSGASIYYTTDGTTPTVDLSGNVTNGTLYTGAISVVASETINAIAAAYNYNTSAEASAVYTMNVPTLSGTVQSGTTPVSGATIQVYAAGTSGYGSAATPLMQSAVTTDANGQFSLVPGYHYNCTPGTWLYLTASGGTPSGVTVSNPGITLVAAIGQCNSPLASSVSVMVNEETTVAAAYALAQFAEGTEFGVPLSSNPGSGSTAPADNIATSSTNVVGLANAMNIANVLVPLSTGLSGTASNASGSATPEFWQVNLLANILAACDLGGAGSSACTALFGNVIPNSGAGGTAPADTFQAALDMALHPTLSASAIAALYGTIPATAPFSPYPTGVNIVDFTVGINIVPKVTVNGTASALLLGTGGMTVTPDSLGNIWVVDSGPVAASVTNPVITCGTDTVGPHCNSFLVELNPVGDIIQAGSTAGNYAINSYAVNGTATTFGGQAAPSSATAYSIYGLPAPAIDTNNNVWIHDRMNGNIVKIPGSGTAFDPTYASYANGGSAGAVGYALAAGSAPASIAVDGSNNVYFAMDGPYTGSTQGNCSTAYGSVLNYTKGVGVFLGGDSTSSIYGGNAQGWSNITSGILAIDPNGNDKVSGAAIPGAPFLWSSVGGGSAPPIYQNYTQSTGTDNTQGCSSTLKSFGVTRDPNLNGTTADTTAATGTTSIPNIANPDLTNDYLKMTGNAIYFAIDKDGNIWTADPGTSNTLTGATTSINASIHKITPNYGTAFTSAQAASNFSFSVFHNVAGMMDGTSANWGNPRQIVVDGAANAYFILNTSSWVQSITSTGEARSYVPASYTSGNSNFGYLPGFQGSTAGSCKLGTVTYACTRNRTVSRPAVDGSGNLWVPASGTNTNYIEVLVGIAAPKVTPDSLGLKNNTFAQKP